MATLWRQEGETAGPQHALSASEAAHRREVYAESDAIRDLFQQYDTGAASFAGFVRGMGALDLDLPPSFFRLVKARIPNFTLSQLMRALLVPNTDEELERPAGHVTAHAVVGNFGDRHGKRRVAGPRDGEQMGSVPGAGVHAHARKRMFGLKQKREHGHLIAPPRAAVQEPLRVEAAADTPEERRAVSRRLAADLVAGRVTVRQFKERLGVAHGGRAVDGQLAELLRRHQDRDELTFQRLHAAVARWASGDRPFRRRAWGASAEGDAASEGGRTSSAALSDLYDEEEHRPARHLTRYKNESHIRALLSPGTAGEAAGGEADAADPDFGGIDELAHHCRHHVGHLDEAAHASGRVSAMLHGAGMPGDDDSGVRRASSGKRASKPARASKIFWSEEEAAAAATAADCIRGPFSAGRVRRRSVQPRVPLYRTHSETGLLRPYEYGAGDTDGSGALPAPPQRAAGAATTLEAPAPDERVCMPAAMPPPAAAAESEADSWAAPSTAPPPSSSASSASLASAAPSTPASGAHLSEECARMLDDVSPRRLGAMFRQLGRPEPGSNLLLEGQPCAFDALGASGPAGRGPAALVAPTSFAKFQRRLRRGRRAYATDAAHGVNREVFAMRAGDFDHLFVFNADRQLVPVLADPGSGAAGARAAARRQSSALCQAQPWGCTLNENDTTFFRPHH